MPPPMPVRTVLLEMVELLIATEPSLASPPPPRPRKPTAILLLMVLLLMTSEPESRPRMPPPAIIAELLNTALSVRMNRPWLVLAMAPPAAAVLPEREQKATWTDTV